MTLREQIVQEALQWVGTPYHGHAALRGVGCDCVGLLLGIARALALVSPDWQPGAYSQEWHLHQNEEQLVHVLEEVGCQALPFDARQPGDILTLQYGRVASHTAVLVACSPADYMVHAARNMGRVVHHRLSGDLVARVRGVYAFPGLEGSA